MLSKNSLGGSSSSIFSSIWSNSVMCSHNPPPHALSLGNLLLSNNRTFNPLSAKYFAAVAPDGPAPQTITSYSSILKPLGEVVLVNNFFGNLKESFVNLNFPFYFFRTFLYEILVQMNFYRYCERRIR